MGILTFVILAFWVIVFYNMGKKEGESKGKSEAYQQHMKETHPYILRKYELVTAKYYHWYCDTLEEAKDESMKLIRKNDLGFVPCEKVEIYSDGEVIETFLTKERRSIEKINGFNFSRYKWEIKPINYKPFDPISIKGHSHIKLLLTSGDVVTLTKPHYSLYSDCLSGKFGAQFSPFDSGKSSDFQIIPFRIIEKVLSPV